MISVNFTIPDELFVPTWSQLQILISIERFDAVWPQINNIESELLNCLRTTLPVVEKPRELFCLLLEDLKGGWIPYSDYVDHLFFWYETDLTIHRVIKCAYINYCYNLHNPDRKHNWRMFQSCLGNIGYDWVYYLNFEHLDTVSNTTLDHWIKSSLEVLREAQLELMKKVDSGGRLQKININEQLLLHIIATYPRITTFQISRKLGRSGATVRRMLASLRNKKLITSKGNGPVVYHTLNRYE